MVKKDIQTQEDIHILVSRFYSKVRKNELLGDIFNTTIKDWDTHLERITLFWESNLFLKTKFYSDPLKVHVNVDKQNNESITQLHFGTWLNLWIETIDELYEGNYANIAKNRARKMGTYMYMKIFEARIKTD